MNYECLSTKKKNYECLECVNLGFPAAMESEFNNNSLFAIYIIWDSWSKYMCAYNGIFWGEWHIDFYQKIR